METFSDMGEAFVGFISISDAWFQNFLNMYFQSHSFTVSYSVNSFPNKAEELMKNWYKFGVKSMILKKLSVTSETFRRIIINKLQNSISFSN